MLSTQSSLGSSQELPLPAQFENIEGLVSMPSERLQKTPLVNVIGLISDYQPPIATKGTDYKCTLTIVDLSTQVESGMGIKVIIFWPQEKMPQISGVSDVVILKKLKVQMWNGYISLLANWASDIHVVPAGKILPWPIPASHLMPRAISSKGIPPTYVEVEYTSWLFHHIDKAFFPDETAFQAKVDNAMKIKEKFSLLKDMKADLFYDLLGEVIKVYEKDGRVALYISDYTAHSLFYNNVWGCSETEPNVRDGDQYGYTTSRKKVTNDWPGPYGKLTFQLTVYDEQAAYIREQVKIGDWILLNNVQAKMGNQGGCLEGILRNGRGDQPGKLLVKIIRKAEDAERIDARWKEGVRRKKEWWDKFKKQKQEYLEEAGGGGGKRKLDKNEGSKNNSKKRRKEQWQAVEQKVVATEQKILKKMDLNSNVKCNHPDKSPVPLNEILNHTEHVVRSVTGMQCALPFVNAKYRSNVRVVDFWPHKIEDFSVGRAISEFDILSDYSGGESTDNEEDMRQFRRGQGFGGEKTWEWRFAFRVTDGGTKSASHNETLWLVIDDFAAQMLLNMDAVNLRQDKESLNVVRELLFTLWGDLEEKKSAYLKTPAGKALLTANSPPPSPASQPIPKTNPTYTRPGDSLPPDSDDEDDDRVPPPPPRHLTALQERSPNIRGKTPHSQNSSSNSSQEPTTLFAAISALPVTNKAFTCCIQQYGIKVPEEFSARADAGPGFRWMKLFGLFGTTIV